MPEIVHGLEELKQKFVALQFEAKHGRKIIRASFRKAANVFRDSARSKAPKLTGELSRKIQTSSPRGRPGTFRFQVRATVRAKPTKKDPKGYPYSAAVELGHGFPGTRSRHFKKNKAKAIEFGTSQVPGRPFMRPAWNDKKQSSLDTFANELGAAIERIAKES